MLHQLLPSKTHHAVTKSKRDMSYIKLIALLAGVVSSTLAFSPPDGLCKFDTNSYTGGWYEIASSAYVGQTTEAGCICPVTYYTTNVTDPTVLDLTNSCIRNGMPYAVSGNVHPAPPGEPQGNLHVSLNYGSNMNSDMTPNYIVLKEYYGSNSQNGTIQTQGTTPQFVLVGGNRENYWWLLSRSPNWDDYIWYNANYVLQGYEYNVTGYRVPEQTCQFLGGHGKNNLIPPPQA